MSASVIRDQNGKPIWWGVSSVDGTTPTPIQINSVGAVLIESGASTMAVMASVPITLPREENRIPCIGGASSAAATVVLPISVNPATGAIQVQYT
jgi:hypothetical protein